MIFPSSAIIRPFAFSLLLCLLARRAIRARPRLGTGDRDGAVIDARRTVLGIIRERVLQVIHVVALLEAVEPLMRTARFPALESRIHHDLRAFESDAQPLG